MSLTGMTVRRIRKIVAWTLATGVLFLIVTGVYFLGVEMGVLSPL